MNPFNNSLIFQSIESGRRDHGRSHQQLQCMWGGDTGSEGRNHHEAGEGASSRHWQVQSRENDMTCVLERGRSHCEEAQMVTIEHDQQSYRVGVSATWATSRRQYLRIPIEATVEDPGA
ncbi:hypothetical protein AHAS_Ahas01G0168600 [Arachis hypogaea]